MACPPGGAFLPGNKLFIPSTDKHQVAVLDVHWGSIDREHRNGNLVKIVQVDYGEQVRWWLVYAYPFVVDAFANHSLHHSDVTIAGNLSTHTLVEQGYIPESYGKYELNIPAAHVIVLHTTNRHKTDQDWKDSFGNLTNVVVFQRWICPALQPGLRLRNLTKVIEKRCSLATIRRHFGLSREHYALWSQPCAEDDDDEVRDNDDDGLWGSSYDPEPERVAPDAVELVSKNEFKRRRRKMRRRPDDQDAQDAFYHSMVTPRLGHFKLRSTHALYQRYRSYRDDAIQCSWTLLKHLSLAPAAPAPVL